MHIIGSVAAACHTVQSHLGRENRERKRGSEREMGEEKEREEGRGGERERKIDHLDVLGPVFKEEIPTFQLSVLLFRRFHVSPD